VQLEKEINMKSYFYIIVFTISFSVYSQKTKTTELDTIRQQGYLIIGTDERGKLSDITTKFLFIPSSNMEENFRLSYTKNNQSNYNDLYIPTPYLYNESELGDLNFYIKKFINKKTEINLNQELVPIANSLKSSNNLYKFKETSKEIIKTFKVVYIDGIWVKLKVSKKLALPISASYNVTRFNRRDNKCFEYYFLIETKAICYDILFTDNSIEIVKE
jgi:hypothetical protein